MSAWSEKYCLVLYDRNDFPLAYFEGYKEASKYLNLSRATILTAISRYEGRTRSGRIFRIDISDDN